MIDTRLLSYIALILVSLLIYDAWMQDYAHPPAQQTSTSEKQAPVHQDIPSAPPVTDASVTTTDLPEVKPDAPVLPAAAVTPAESVTRVSQVITVENDVLRLLIDTRGGTIIQADLLKYPVDLKHPEQPVRLLADSERFYVAQSGLISVNKQTAPDHYAQFSAERDSYKLEDQDQLSVPLVWRDESGVEVVKTFTLKRDDYAIDITHRINNNSGQVWQGSQYRQLQRNQLDSDSSYFIYTYTGAVIYSPEKKYEKIDFDSIAKAQLQREFAGGWAAMIEHYFLSAWIPEAENINSYYTRLVKTSAGNRYVIGLTSPSLNIETGASGEFSTLLYIGPKIQKQLEPLAKGLELTVDFGYLTIISQPLFWLLDKIHSLVGNWGWSIILVTLLIKLVFYKLAEASYRSMAKMRQAQPKMLAIRERYANDRQRQGQAMMELYKKEKINPLGGCLPMLVQIPVFIALYWVLLESVELRQAPFILWINDLSVKDPYFVLPVIMGISMYIQQKLNPAPLDPMQAKVFMILPFVFTVFFAFFPSGLVLYWVVNNVLTIIQQWHIIKRVESGK